MLKLYLEIQKQVFRYLHSIQHEAVCEEPSFILNDEVARQIASLV
jgi:hypothetical protein